MAAITLQPPSAESLQIHRVASAGSLAPQQALSEYCNVLTDSSLPAIPSRQRQCDPSCSGSSIGALLSLRASEELLWRRFFLDPNLRWDGGNFGSRSLRHSESKEVLWLNKFWVDAQLGPPPSTPNSTLPCGPGPCRVVAGWYGSDVTAEAVSRLCEKGQLSDAVDALGVLVQTATRVSPSLLYSVLKGCVSQKNLVLGRRVHELAAEAGCESTTFLANHILRMYASHGRLQEVKDVFSKVANPDAFSWSAVIAAHAKNGEPKQALHLYQKMHISGVKPDCHVFVAALQACASAADLECGKRVHSDLLESGVQPDLFVWNCLVDMYAKCGRLEDARMVFDSLATKDVVTCSTMIAGYAKSGRLEDARMVLDSLPTKDVVICTTMIAGYAKCGKLEDARMLFDSLVTRNVETWTAMIAGYVEHEHIQEAFSLYEQMEQEGRVVANSVTFSCLLKGCTRVGDLQRGKQLHSQILERGLESDTVVGTCLVDMYAKCGRLENARTIFDNLVTRNVVTWNAMIAGYAKCGRMEDARQIFDGLVTKNVVTWNTMIAGYAQHEQGQEALSLYEAMEAEGVVAASSVTFACLLKACASVGALHLGKQLHSHILERGLEADTVLCNSLIHMYENCGKLEDARRVFDSLPTKDVVSWTAMIAGYVHYGHGQEALAVYEFMQRDGMSLPNSVTFISLLQACASTGDLNQGKQLHTKIQELGLEADVVVGTCLVDMYSKCSCIEAACNVFKNLPTKNVSTWNAMITGYAQHGLGQQALTLYGTMKGEGIAPDAVTFVCVLHACAIGGTMHQGKQLHAQIQERGLEADIVVGNCLLHMYAKCGSMQDARQVFDNLPNTNVVTWNTMIIGYVQHGLGHEALDLFSSMHLDADHVTFICVLQACVDMGALNMGKLLHRQIQDRGLETDVTVATCLVDLHAKCGSLEDARGLFDAVPVKNVAIWNAMIGGYLQHGLCEDALALYASMQLCSTVRADRVTFLCLLQACASIGALAYAQQLHGEINDGGLDSDLVVSSTLLDTYAKCGRLQDARKLFDRLLKGNVVTWNAMIAAYSQQGLGQAALDLYASMEQERGIRADRVTFLSLLQACASVGALHSGKHLHANIQASGLEADVVIGSSLVDMYAKCGSLKDARKVFDRLPTKNVVTWNSLLTGYALHSNGQSAIHCLEEMCRHGVKPDGTTFICLLTACSHAGLVHEGQRCFRMMIEDHGIRPTTNHFNCMVDLLGRAGCLDEAEAVMQTLPEQTNSVGWTSLLSACKIHRDVERGQRCFDHLVLSEPENAAAYVIMANLYASVGRWRDVNRIERLRKSAGAWKKPAKACIEAKGKVQEFTVGDERLDVSSKLKSANLSLKEGGHVPQTELVLNVALEKEKEDALCGHAEKLALAYGLLNTPDGTTLLVTKNLRMCNDCHSSTKVLSRLEGREIVVRDAHRVHRFLDGSCSCGDRH